MDESEYIKERLDNQIEWYDAKSMKNQKIFKRIRIAEIGISASIPILSMFSDTSPIIKIIVAILGVLIVASISIQGMGNYHENWLEYRMIAETLKHEKFLYLTKSGVYENLEKPLGVLVGRVEGTISRENANWSQLNRSAKPKNNQHSTSS